MDTKDVAIWNLTEDTDNIRIDLKNHDDAIKRYINDVYEDGYKKGFEQGILRGSELTLEEMDIDNLDMNSIRVFAIFCYVNGIDFSYMAKSEDKVPFIERVINRFNECIINNDVSVEAYKEKLKRDEEKRVKYRINCRYSAGCKNECLCAMHVPLLREVDYDKLSIDIDPDEWKEICDSKIPMDILASSINENGKMDPEVLIKYYRESIKEEENDIYIYKNECTFELVIFDKDDIKYMHEFIEKRYNREILLSTIADFENGHNIVSFDNRSTLIHLTHFIKGVYVYAHKNGDIIKFDKLADLYKFIEKRYGRKDMNSIMVNWKNKFNVFYIDDGIIYYISE